MKNICIAGGVAQNSVANGKLTRNTEFRNIYIPSAGHDAGISMGSALYVYNQILRRPRQPAVLFCIYRSRFSNEEIETFLKSRGIEYTRYSENEIYEIITDRLVDAGVVGWFTGTG